MKKISVLVCVFLLGFFNSRAGALSLEEARELALTNSRSLATASMSERSSALTQKTQFHSLLPSISLGASAGTTLWNKDGSSAELLSDSVSAGADLTIKETLPIWDGKKYSIQSVLNSLSTESARQDVLTAYYNVLSSVDTAYYAVLEAAASLESAETSLETASLSLSIAEIRRAASMISEANYLQALAEKESRENARNQARRSLSLEQIKLKNLLGLDTGPGSTQALPELEPVDFSSLESLIRALDAVDDPGLQRLYEQLWKDIERRNPALLKAGINTSKAEQALKGAAWAYSPTLSASVSAGLGYDFKKGNFNNDGKFSLNLSIPLDVWVTAANVEQKQLTLNQSSLAFRDARETLDIQLQSCLMNLAAQAGQVNSSQRALEYAQLNLDRVMELYRMNQSSQSSITEAESLRRTNRNNLIKAQYAVLSQLSTLRSLGAFETDQAIMDLLLRETLR